MSYSMLRPRKIVFSSLNSLNKFQRCVATKVVPLLDDEYTKEPEYPSIQNLSYKSKFLRRRLKWYDDIKSLDTVEEKLMALNMPRYYGYKCLMLNDEAFKYNCLPFVQHVTRTVISEGLPKFYEQSKLEESLLDVVRADIQDAVAFEKNGYSTSNEYNEHDPESVATFKRDQTTRITSQINRVILNALAANNTHLSEIEIDVNPRHEAFWFVGGIQPPVSIEKFRKNSFQKNVAEDPVNRQFQYVGQPTLTIRHRHPLQEIETNESAESKAGEPTMPTFNYDPRTLGYFHAYRHGTTIPGFWPGSEHEFGLLSYHSRHHIDTRKPTFGAADNQEALHAQAILASYSWLLGQACYQGFSTVTDLTYPLTTQTIITDGQTWSFYAYQLNTTENHQDAFDNNPKVNKCWATNEMKLYDEIDADGKLIGFNDEVVKNLIQFYLNEPQERNIDMKPYLGDYEKIVADIEDPKRRTFLESRYKHLGSDRPRHRLVPEIYDWEKIYKIDNKTLPLKPKRRFFELFINPFKRTLDDHTPVYIPRALRPEGPKSKDKWEKTYYPLSIQKYKFTRHQK